MLIYKALDLDIGKQNIISFVGGGGKSTSMDIISKELRSIGKKVLVTTTTVIFEPQHKDNDKFILGEFPEDYNPANGTITLLGKSMDDGKIRGLDQEELEEIYIKGIFDVILIEADGARGKPIKAPATHEPVVPSFSTMTIGVIGLDSIGKPLDEDNVHRLEFLTEILNVERPHTIDSEDIIKLAIHKDGLFKGCYGKQVIFLNKAYNENLVLIGANIRRNLYDKGSKDVYVTDIRRSRIY